MPREATPEAVYDAALYAMATHLSAHGEALRIQGLAPVQRGCQTCEALLGTVGLAHELVETTATPRRTRHDT